MFNMFNMFNTCHHVHMCTHSHELPEKLSAGVTGEQLRPVHHEAVRQEIHHAPGKAKRLDAAEALTEDSARGRPQSEHAQRERSEAHRDARACIKKERWQRGIGGVLTTRYHA